MKTSDVGWLEVVRWHVDLVDGHYRIVLDVIKVVDPNGRFIKFASHEKVSKYLAAFPVKFNPNG